MYIIIIKLNIITQFVLNLVRRKRGFFFYFYKKFNKNWKKKFSKLQQNMADKSIYKLEWNWRINVLRRRASEINTYTISLDDTDKVTVSILGTNHFSDNSFTHSNCNRNGGFISHIASLRLRAFRRQITALNRGGILCSVMRLVLFRSRRTITVID